jgi:hypothetical protein
VHFCFELMWLVIEVFVTCVFDVWQIGIHCLLRFHILRTVLLRFISSGMWCGVTWYVVREVLKDCIACIIRVKGPLISRHSVISQKIWICIQCLMPRPWSLCSICYCCSVLLRWFWFTPTGKCGRQSSRYFSLQALHHLFTFIYLCDKPAYLCYVWPSS